MRIGILGGTGRFGEGLALRWGRDTDHEILVGSRDAERARTTAAEYADELRTPGAIEGMGNQRVAAQADVLVTTVPPEYLEATIEEVAAELTGDTVVLSPAVDIERDETWFHHAPPAIGSTTEFVADAVPEEVPVVGALHTLPAGKLAAIDEPIEWDTVVVGDDTDAKATVEALIEEIDGIRALDGGPLANAGAVEAITPVLITLSMHNDGLHDIGIQIR